MRERTYETSNDEILRWLYPYRVFHLMLVIDRDNHVDNKTEGAKKSMTELISREILF